MTTSACPLSERVFIEVSLLGDLRTKKKMMKCEPQVLAFQSRKLRWVICVAEMW